MSRCQHCGLRRLMWTKISWILVPGKREATSDSDIKYGKHSLCRSWTYTIHPSTRENWRLPKWMVSNGVSFFQGPFFQVAAYSFPGYAQIDSGTTANPLFCRQIPLFIFNIVRLRIFVQMHLKRWLNWSQHISLRLLVGWWFRFVVCNPRKPLPHKTWIINPLILAYCHTCEDALNIEIPTY